MGMERLVVVVVVVVGIKVFPSVVDLFDDDEFRIVYW